MNLPPILSRYKYCSAVLVFLRVVAGLHEHLFGLHWALNSMPMYWFVVTENFSFDSTLQITESSVDSLKYVIHSAGNITVSTLLRDSASYNLRRSSNG